MEKRVQFLWCAVIFALLIPLQIWFAFPFDYNQEAGDRYLLGFWGAVALHMLALAAWMECKRYSNETSQGPLRHLAMLIGASPLVMLFYFFLDFFLILAILSLFLLACGALFFVPYFVIVNIFRSSGLLNGYSRSQELLEDRRYFLIGVLAIPALFALYSFLTRKQCAVHWQSGFIGIYTSYEECVEKYRPLEGFAG